METKQTQITQIPRPFLMKRLNSLASLRDSSRGSSRNRLMYMHAPAGFGKTTSSLLWLEHREKALGEKRVWFGFDEYDNKTSEFCSRFVSALVTIQPQNTVLKELATHPKFRSAPVEFTLRALTAFNENQSKYIFVFDDLHVIINHEVLELLLVLIKRLPENCKVLLLSRTLPPEQFSKMIVNDELSIIDVELLQFSCSEIKALFDNNGKNISKNQANEILISTGGWAIGLRAILMSKFNEKNEKSYGINLSSQYLDSFLSNHVWERWDKNLKSFMTSVAVVSELTPDLCGFLTGTDSSRALSILEELVRGNAFLRKTGSLSDGEHTYRFHDLFREFLLSILEKENRAIKQFSRAGDYFYKRNDYFRSVKYYFKGKNDNGIAKSLYCMYDYNSQYASIEDTLNTVYSSVDDTIVKKFPFLLEVQAWAEFVDGSPERLEEILDKYYKLSPKIIVQNPRSAVTLVLLRCMDHRENFIQIMKKLNRVPFKGGFKAAMPSISQNMPFFHRSSRDFSELSLDIDKNVKLVYKVFGRVIDELSVIGECFYAGFYYEKGELNKALEHALKACANIKEENSSEIKFCAMMILASIFHADTQVNEAQNTIKNVQNMIEADKAFYLSTNLSAYLFRLKLSEGDKDAAQEWLKKHSANLTISEGLSFFKIYQYFTTARAYIVMGNYADAILFLQKLLNLNERYRRTLDIIEVCVLLSIVYWKKGKGAQATALEYLKRAISLAYEYNYTQIFANEGAELVNMLHKLLKRSVQKKSEGEPSSGFVKTLYVAAVGTSEHSKGLTGGRISENITFTDKQKAVMRLMCEGYTRNEIAEKTGLKPNTVKSHTELIYKKLDVSNSINAVLKIKKLDVL
jgi:LuxR family maltose regulon positive regulatory protein